MLFRVKMVFRTMEKRKPGRRPISAEKRAEIIAALYETPNAKQVAKQRGDVSQRSVWNIAKAAGIELTYSIKTEEKRAEIIAALHETPNASRVAKKLGGVTNVTVCKIAKAAEIKLAEFRRPKGACTRASKQVTRHHSMN